MTNKNSAIFEYLALTLILGLGAVFYFSFRYHPFEQFLVVVATSVGYVIWGTIHHLLRVRLYWHIIYEYILLAALVILLFGFTLNIF